MRHATDRGGASDVQVRLPRLGVGLQTGDDVVEPRDLGRQRGGLVVDVEDEAERQPALVAQLRERRDGLGVRGCEPDGCAVLLDMGPSSGAGWG